VDVLSKECRLRFIITVAALKEGWDCPFAYVLYSVAELESQKGIEQILGRVLRLPNAKRKQRADLNCAYAFVSSDRFDNTARALLKGLVDAGFNRQEAADLIVPQELPLTTAAPPAAGPVTITLTTPPTESLPLSVADAVVWSQPSNTLTLTKALTGVQEADLAEFVATPQDKAAIANACAQKAGRLAVINPKSLCPAKRGVVFSLPVLALQQGNFVQQLETDDLYERMEWSLAEADCSLPEFFLPEAARGVMIDVTDDERLRQSFIPIQDRQLELLQLSEAWTVGRLVHFLERSFAHEELTDAEIGIYLTRVVGALVDHRQLTLEQLTAHRYRLAKAVKAKLDSLRAAAMKQALETLLLAEASSPYHVTAAAAFTFDPDKYPCGDPYEGLAFTKHYYEAVGDLPCPGEEYDCARVIDGQPGVEFWVRNLSNQPATSFWLQTSKDRFYPDFVCRLVSGKTLVIEYKGSHLAESSDTREKERLGQLWAERSNGACLFLMVRTPQELGRIVAAAKQ
jgi:type III restriction enzyme